MTHSFYSQMLVDTYYVIGFVRPEIPLQPPAQMMLLLDYLH